MNMLNSSTEAILQSVNLLRCFLRYAATKNSVNLFGSDASAIGHLELCS